MTNRYPKTIYRRRFTVKRILLLALALSALVFTDKPTGVWRFARTNSMYSTAWNHPGTIIDLGDKEVCHYVGQINFPVNSAGQCDNILILHLAKAQAMEENGKIIGLYCAYDWSYPDMGGNFLTNDVYRENCPDILATVNGGFNVIGEYWFKPKENQTIYYEDGAPIRQTLSNTREVLDRFDKKYENQIRYRDTYDWIQLKPGYGWDQWERPGSVYGKRMGK